MSLNYKVFVTKDGIKKEIKSNTIKVGECYNKFFIKTHRKGTIYRTTFNEPINISNDDNLEISEEISFK